MSLRAETDTRNRGKRQVFFCRVACCCLIAHGIDQNVLLRHLWPWSNYPKHDSYWSFFFCITYAWRLPTQLLPSSVETWVLIFTQPLWTFGRICGAKMRIGTHGEVRLMVRWWNIHTHLSPDSFQCILLSSWLTNCCYLLINNSCPCDCSRVASFAHFTISNFHIKVIYFIDLNTTLYKYTFALSDKKNNI